MDKNEQDILCEISKGTFEISHKICYLYTKRFVFMQRRYCEIF